MKEDGRTGSLLIGGKKRLEWLDFGVRNSFRAPKRESLVGHNIDDVALVLQQRLGSRGLFEELGAVDEMCCLGQFGQVRDGGDRVVDREQESAQAELGQCHFEKGFIDGRAGEDSDDLDGRDLAGSHLGRDTEFRIVPCETINGRLCLLESEEAVNLWSV